MPRLKITDTTEKSPNVETHASSEKSTKSPTEKTMRASSLRLVVEITVY